MSNGKGSSPRPYSVRWSVYEDAWTRTFGRPHPVHLTSTDLSVDCDTLRHATDSQPGGDLRLHGAHDTSTSTETPDGEVRQG